MNKIHKISVKLDDELYNLINDLSLFIDLDFSKTVRELLNEGLMIKAQSKMYSVWENKVKNRKNFFSCDKCGTTENIQLYHIDGNINNFNDENIAVLCNGDLHNLKKSIMKNSKEKFIRWFFFENNTNI